MGLQEIRESLALIDYITPNEDEAKYLTGKERPEEMADVFLQSGVKNVIIKLGSKGCFLKNKEQAIRLEAYPVRAAESTGCGDHFAAGFVSGIMSGKAPEEALRFANACGGCLRYGDRCCNRTAKPGTSTRVDQEALNRIKKGTVFRRDTVPFPQTRSSR